MEEFFIFDTETASLKGGVCELAYLKVNEKLEIIDEFCSFVNPERAIEDGARNIHGILDEQVVNAPTLAKLQETLPLMMGEVNVVGHNLVFDLRMTKGYVTPKVRLCTLRLARQYLNQTSNKLDELQRALGLPERKSHTALGDVHTCRDLLSYILQAASTDMPALVLRAQEPTMVNKMPFGKHRGQAVVSLPKNYRDWLVQQDIDKDLRFTLEKLSSV